RHPFAADTVFEVLHRIVTQVAIAPSAADSTLPHALDAVILAMLEKEPGRRPAAAEVADTLASLMCTAPTTPVRRALLSRSRRYVVGRESERAELRSAFEQVAVGAGLLISIGGEPGLGKTTVADEFLRDLAASGEPFHVARGRASERLAGTEAYLPVLEAIDSLLDGPSGGSLSHAMQAMAPTWYAQCRPLGRADPPAVAGAPVAASQERMKRELATFLQEITRRTPLVLFLDDVHWADPSTIELLAYLA